ncbi:Crp/Fnr family transcriptional regulator [Flavicella sediminum]|uniref:Crp/Fnr family transcriptional regulator n=1 Tax=Flavicella sediminum TaxID=2585141 RepID=UPI001122DB0B|nr:Crp/Fnr family transcriptional regulator [Flavicella sediminum]
MDSFKNNVKNIINEVCPISELAFEAIEKYLEFESYAKGADFISLNKENDKEYFMLKGICKSYLINPEGDEITISFYVENSILSPHSIRTSNMKANQYFKALTNVELASINASKFEALMIENLEIRNFGNVVLQKELLSKVDKEIGLASLSAKDRLLKFRRKYKMLENLIPHGAIASYLGITNVSLSRLRKE